MINLLQILKNKTTNKKDIADTDDRTHNPIGKPVQLCVGLPDVVKKCIERFEGSYEEEVKITHSYLRAIFSREVVTS